MIEIWSGARADVIYQVSRRIGSGTITLTDPQRRILDSAKAVVTGYDWAAATWDASGNYLYAMFDSSVAALSVAGIYYMDLRGTIGTELYRVRETIKVK